VNRLELGKIFSEGILRDRGAEGPESGRGGGASWVHPMGGGGFPDLHFTSVSRIMNQRSKMQRKQT